MRQIRRRSRDGTRARSGSLDWYKTTVKGFNLVHIGSLLVLVLLGAGWAYGFRNDPDVVPAWILLDHDNFAYWTIMNVTLSFRPR